MRRTTEAKMLLYMWVTRPSTIAYDLDAGRTRGEATSARDSPPLDVAHLRLRLFRSSTPRPALLVETRPIWRRLSALCSIRVPPCDHPHPPRCPPQREGGRGR